MDGYALHYPPFLRPFLRLDLRSAPFHCVLQTSVSDSDPFVSISDTDDTTLASVHYACAHPCLVPLATPEIPASIPSPLVRSPCNISSRADIGREKERTVRVRRIIPRRAVSVARLQDRSRPYACIMYATLQFASLSCRHRRRAVVAHRLTPVAILPRSEKRGSRMQPARCTCAAAVTFCVSICMLNSLYLVTPGAAIHRSSPTPSPTLSI